VRFAVGHVEPSVGKQYAVRIDWAFVPPKLSSRACAFDRPGYAWSEPAGVVDDGVSRAMNNSALQQRLQAELARLSTNVMHVTVDNFCREYHDARWMFGGVSPSATRIPPEVAFYLAAS
jgi:hypothetical protein